MLKCIVSVCENCLALLITAWNNLLINCRGTHFCHLILFFCVLSFPIFDFTESSKEQFAYTNIAEELVKLFKKQIEHDKKEMIFEVLAPLAENGETPVMYLFMSERKRMELLPM